MTYRENQKPLPEINAARPELTWRQKLLLRFDLSLNLASEEWFRRHCGGTWVKSSYYYHNAVPGRSLWCGAGTLDEWPVADGSLPFYLAEWLPLVHKDPNLGYHIRYEHLKEALWAMFYLEQRTCQFLYMNDGEYKAGADCGVVKMPESTIEVYPYPLVIDPRAAFEPSLMMLLADWPDYWHMRDCKMVKQ